MEKSGDCDSDGSISWEDFFGSSTDLVPTLLTMYDSLIAQSLSSQSGEVRLGASHHNQHQQTDISKNNHHDSSDQVRWVSMAMATAAASTSSSSSSSSSLSKSTSLSSTGGGKEREATCFSSTDRNNKSTNNSHGGGFHTAADNGGSGGNYKSSTSVVGGGDWTTKPGNSVPSCAARTNSRLNLQSSSSSSNNNYSVVTTPLSASSYSSPLKSRNCVNARTTSAIVSVTKEWQKHSSRDNFLCNNHNNKITTTSATANNNNNSNNNNKNNKAGVTMKNSTTEETKQRPLSVNSTVSSTSSSSCSSESSASLNNAHGMTIPLAPRASPEEDAIVISTTTTNTTAIVNPDDQVRISEGDGDDQNDYHCAKTTSNSNNSNNNVSAGNGTERCFNNSTAVNKDCVENGNRGGGGRMISSAQGRPRFCYMDRVVMEIVETERLYVNDLREIISGYLEHWILEPDETLPVHDVQELFSNIDEIHQFNSEFLKQLEGCGLNPVQVARCFVTSNEGFTVYTQYCTNYPRTMSILTEMMRQEQSAKSFRERQAILGHTLPLGSYLLKPVQRILKYHLLLQNIVKHYDHGADGYDTIVEALSAMTNIAHHINDMKRRHEHAVRVQEIQSLLYGWQGEDLTTYGELCAEGTFRVYGAKALRHVFLFDKMLLITKKKDDGGILSYKSHIMCSNLMLIESVPGEPTSFHVIPFDNPRRGLFMQARNLEQKREWTLQLKRVILENYHAVIPSHARQLVMELGQYRAEDEQVISERQPTKRQHSAPEYLERRKQEKERRKSESTLKARLRRGGKKGDPTSPKENSPGAFRRSRRTSMDPTMTTRDRSESREDGREVAIDRKMSSASCPPCGTTEKRLVKKLSGWRRKSEPGFYLQSPHLKLGKAGTGGNGNGGNGLISGPNGESDLTLDSNESIGEEDVGELESSSQIDLCCTEEENELDDSLEQMMPNNNNNSGGGGGGHGHHEERRESIEEIVGQLVMQNRDFQRILNKISNKQRLVHLRKALAQHNHHVRQDLSEECGEEEEETASETETEEPIENDLHLDPPSPLRLTGGGGGRPGTGQQLLDTKLSLTENEGEGRIGSGHNSCGSQVSSSNGIGGSSSDMMNENSSENISIGTNEENILTTTSSSSNSSSLSSSTNTKNVQRTVSDPGNKATLTPRRFISGPFAHYDPISLLWSSFRRTSNSTSSSATGTSKQTNSPSKSKGKTNIRHTHSFTCSHKESDSSIPLMNHTESKEPLPLPHGDSGIFPNSFTSDSSSSSEANIPTLPAVWLMRQDEHLATPNNKSGSLPRSFQVCQHTNNSSIILQPPSSPKLEANGQKIFDNNCKNAIHSTSSSPSSAATAANGDGTNSSFKSRLRDGGKYADRPFTIASDKPSSSDISYDEMEQYMSKFNDQMARKSPSMMTAAELEEDVDDLTTELTPVTSMENLNLHPDHKIYRPSKSSIKHMLLSVTNRLSGIKANIMVAGGNGHHHHHHHHNSHTSSTAHTTTPTISNGSSRENFNFGSIPNIPATTCNASAATNGHGENNCCNNGMNRGESHHHLDGKLMSNGGGATVCNGKHHGLNQSSSRNYRKSLKQKIKHIVREDRGDSDSENCESATCSSSGGSSGFGSLGSCGSSSNNLTSKIGARLAQCCEHSDYALSKLLGSTALTSSNSTTSSSSSNNHHHDRPQSVMSVSSTVTSSSSTDEKTSSGLGESLSESNNGGEGGGGGRKKFYRINRKGINHRDLYLSYIDQDGDQALSDSDASADSFYERSFEAIESFLENEIFPDSAIYSDQDENGFDDSMTMPDGLCSNHYHHLIHYHHSIGGGGDGNLISSNGSGGSGSVIHNGGGGAGANFSSSGSSSSGSCHRLAPSVPNKPSSSASAAEHRKSRNLVRSQVILEKLKHLEQCSQFHREEPPSPSFEGIKSIQERRKELDLWRGGSGPGQSSGGGSSSSSNRGGEDESETSSQHSTSTINTVIELSPSKSTSFPSSRRCSDTDSSGGNSPLTERAISRSSSCNGHHQHPQTSSSSSSSAANNRPDPMPKGWVKLVVGKLQGGEQQQQHQQQPQSTTTSTTTTTAAASSTSS